MKGFSHACIAQVVWVVRHGEIGDAFFDFDAAQFLLGQLSQRCEAPAQHAASPQHAAEETADEQSSIPANGASSKGSHPMSADSAAERVPSAGVCAGEACDGERCASHAGARPSRVGNGACGERTAHDAERRASHGGAGPGNAGNGACGERAARYGYAVGPRWAQALPGQGARGRLTLERGCNVVRLVRAHDLLLWGCSLCILDVHTLVAGSGASQMNKMPCSLRPSWHFATSPEFCERIHARLCTIQISSLACRQVDLHREAPDAHDAPAWPARLELSNGRSYDVDLVVSAIGVEVRSAWLPAELERCADDGGILVDACAHCQAFNTVPCMLQASWCAAYERMRKGSTCAGARASSMLGDWYTAALQPAHASAAPARLKAGLAHRELRTSVPGVWAAGDCCTVRAEAQEPLWFQMRLWTQVQPMQARNLTASIHRLGKQLNLLLSLRDLNLRVVLYLRCQGQRAWAGPWSGKGPVGRVWAELAGGRGV